MFCLTVMETPSQTLSGITCQVPPKPNCLGETKKINIEWLPKLLSGLPYDPKVFHLFCFPFFIFSWYSLLVCCLNSFNVILCASNTRGKKKNKFAHPFQSFYILINEIIHSCTSIVLYLYQSNESLYVHAESGCPLSSELSRYVAFLFLVGLLNHECSFRF